MDSPLDKGGKGDLLFMDSHSDGMRTMGDISRDFHIKKAPGGAFFRVFSYLRISSEILTKSSASFFRAISVSLYFGAISI